MDKITRSNRPVVIVLIIGVLLFLVYEIFNAEREKKMLIQRNEALRNQIARVIGEMEQRDKKLGDASKKAAKSEDQVKELLQQFTECKEKYNDAMKNAEDLRVKNDEYKAKADDLQTILNKKMELISKLAQASGTSDILALGAAAEAPAEMKVSKSLSSASQSTAPYRCHIWMGQVDTNSINGVLKEKETTLSGCQRYCIDTPACVAVDFNTASVPNPTCWVHTDTKDLQERNTFQQYGTTQYRLNRICLNKTKS